MQETPVAHQPRGREARKKQEIEARRSDALAAASIVFAEKGYHDAQIAEIAQRAEVSLASLYALFSGKEQLYQEVVASAALRMRNGVRERVSAIEDSRDRLLTLVDALLETFDTNHDTLRIVLSGTNGFPWRIKERLGTSADLFDDFNAWVTTLCSEAIADSPKCELPPHVLAATLIGAVTTTVAWALEGGASPFVESRADLRKVVRQCLGDAAS